MDQGPAFVSAAWKNELMLKGTDARVTVAYSTQSNCRPEKMMQTIKSAIMRMCMEREVEWDEPLPVIVNSIRVKKGRDGYSPYEMMFTISTDRLMSPVMNPVECFDHSDEELDQGPNRNSRIMKVPAIQSRRAEWRSRALRTPINPYSTDNWVLVRNPLNVGRAALTPK